MSGIWGVHLKELPVTLLSSESEVPGGVRVAASARRQAEGKP